MSPHSLHAEAHGPVAAPQAVVFEYLDDQSNLSSHMSRSSAAMLGSSITIHMEPDHARRVGSKFGFKGSILGIPLHVDEIVTTRIPPVRKSWETTGEPHLWVIGPYRMGFELLPEGTGCILRVHIDYDLPAHGIGRLLAVPFSRIYARWCTHQMVSDAQHHFDKAMR